jgi:hypothetical protein
MTSFKQEAQFGGGNRENWKELEMFSIQIIKFVTALLKNSTSCRQYLHLSNIFKHESYEPGIQSFITAEEQFKKTF